MVSGMGSNLMSACDTATNGRFRLETSFQALLMAANKAGVITDQFMNQAFATFAGLEFGKHSLKFKCDDGLVVKFAQQGDDFEIEILVHSSLVYTGSFRDQTGPGVKCADIFTFYFSEAQAR